MILGADLQLRARLRGESDGRRGTLEIVVFTFDRTFFRSMGVWTYLYEMI